MSGWDFNGNSEKVEFTAFPEGVTKLRVLSKEPKLAWTHWIMKAKRSIICPGRDCPICQIRKTQKENKQPVTHSVTRRLRIYVFNYDTNRVEVLEQGITFFEELADMKKELEKEGKDFRKAIFKVKRKGTSKETTSYRIDLDSYDESLSLDESAKLIENLQPISQMFQPHEPEKILRILNGEEWNEVFAQPISDEDKQDDEQFEVE